jgi:hypothetical protein
MKCEIEVAWRYHGAGKKGITRKIVLTAVAMEEMKSRIIKRKILFPSKNRATIRIGCGS